MAVFGKAWYLLILLQQHIVHTIYSMQIYNINHDFFFLDPLYLTLRYYI